MLPDDIGILGRTMGRQSMGEQGQEHEVRGQAEGGEGMGSDGQGPAPSPEPHRPGRALWRAREGSRPGSWGQRLWTGLEAPASAPAAEPVLHSF